MKNLRKLNATLLGIGTILGVALLIIWIFAIALKGNVADSLEKPFTIVGLITACVFALLFISITIENLLDVFNEK